MRLVGLWILLVAVYAATLSIPARTGLDYAGAEPHHLLAAESIVSDRDVDLTDEYADRAYASWYPRELRTDGQVVGGRLVEPHGVGFALLIAPAYAIGGARAVQGQMLVLRESPRFQVAHLPIDLLQLPPRARQSLLQPGRQRRRVPEMCRLHPMQKPRIDRQREALRHEERFQLRIPAKMNARSGDAERRFRASRTLIGAKRRRQRVW